MYCFKSVVGMWTIRRLHDGWWGLWLDDEYYSRLPNPAALADDVACFVTGCSKWDSLSSSGVYRPHDLSEWQHLRLR